MKKTIRISKTRLDLRQEHIITLMRRDLNHVLGAYAMTDRSAECLKSILAHCESRNCA